jgi:transcriptional regulator of nitric oxide reductase
MERLDILFAGIGVLVLAAIAYFYWIIGDLQRWFNALRRPFVSRQVRHSRPQAKTIDP